MFSFSVVNARDYLRAMVVGICRRAFIVALRDSDAGTICGGGLPSLAAKPFRDFADYRTAAPFHYHMITSTFSYEQHSAWPWR